MWHIKVLVLTVYAENKPSIVFEFTVHFRTKSYKFETIQSGEGNEVHWYFTTNTDKISKFIFSSFSKWNKERVILKMYLLPTSILLIESRIKTKFTPTQRILNSCPDLFPKGKITILVLIKSQSKNMWSWPKKIYIPNQIFIGWFVFSLLGQSWNFFEIRKY